MEETDHVTNSAFAEYANWLKFTLGAHLPDFLLQKMAKGVKSAPEKLAREATLMNNYFGEELHLSRTNIPSALLHTTFSSGLTNFWSLPSIRRRTANTFKSDSRTPLRVKIPSQINTRRESSAQREPGYRTPA